MPKLNVVGVDLAKNVIQVAFLTPGNRELCNPAFTRRKFAEFLARQRSSLVEFDTRLTSEPKALANAEESVHETELRGKVKPRTVAGHFVTLTTL